MLIIPFALSSFGQTSNVNEKRWSNTTPLTESDFQMTVGGSEHNPCFALFSINYSVNGFDFMTKNFNQKVECIMYRSASWLNENAADKARLIQFQQIQFDISELYARKFRKLLLENRKKIAHGTQIVEELNEQVMKEFTEERAQFEKESEGGLNEQVMVNWRNRLSVDISKLELFSYKNTKKIKLEKK